MTALKIRLLSLIVSVLKLLVAKFAKDYHLAKNPVHTKPRKKAVKQEEEIEIGGIL